MAIRFDNNQNYHLYLNRKRCFLILLLLNSCLAGIYYVYEQNQLKLTQHVKTYTQHISPRINKAIEFIKNTLNNEYNQEDLVTFYELVEKEFTLGLRCMRKTIQSPTITITNVNNTVDKQINSSKTTIRSLNTTNPSRISLPRRHQRTELYSFVLNNSEGCLNEPIDLLVIIISKSESYKTRDAIRRTWGSGKNLGIYSSINIKVFFLIDYDDKLTYNIRLENNLFHDIIQVELPQQYTLVTHRVLSLLEWSFRFCRTAKYVFKTDDDVFINFILLLKFVSKLDEKVTNNSFRISDMTLYGYKIYNPTVFRHANDPVAARYVITFDEFPCVRYPDFLSGFGYLIPKKARDALVYAAYQDLNPFRISDVYITGILPDYLSLPRQPMSNYNIRYTGSCDGFFDNSNSFACGLSMHHGDTSDIFDKFNRYWQRARQFL